MTFNCMIAGVGGQGTVLASKLIASAAMKQGYNVRTTETIGMAQRGGSVVSHVRIGDIVFSPLIPLYSADALIAFEPAEAVRQLAFLRQDKVGTPDKVGVPDKSSIVLVCDSAIKPAGSHETGAYKAAAMIDYLKANAPRLVVIDKQRLAVQNVKTLNVVLLGAAAQNGIFPFNTETLIEVLREKLPERFLEMNLKAFELGQEICQ